MRATVLDGVDPAFGALEQDALAEHDLATALALCQLATKECRVPVVAEPKTRLEIGTPWPARMIAAAGSWSGLVLDACVNWVSHDSALLQFVRKSMTSRLNS